MAVVVHIGNLCEAQFFVTKTDMDMKVVRVVLRLRLIFGCSSNGSSLFAHNWELKLKMAMNCLNLLMGYIPFVVSMG